jgi:hypothetical protein
MGALSEIANQKHPIIRIHTSKKWLPDVYKNEEDNNYRKWVFFYI